MMKTNQTTMHSAKYEACKKRRVQIFLKDVCIINVFDYWHLKNKTFGGHDEMQMLRICMQI